MTREEVLKGLDELVADRDSFIDKYDPDCPFAYDKKILEEAIKLLDEDEMQEIKALCKPIADYLSRKFNPHVSIIVSDRRVKLVSDEMSIPLEGVTTEG